jgi:hypothetical protein
MLRDIGSHSAANMGEKIALAVLIVSYSLRAAEVLVLPFAIVPP